MEITFKTAKDTDIDLLALFVRDFYEYDQHHFDETIVRAALTRFLSDETLGQTWLILADGEAVGYMVLTLGYSLSHPGREAFVDEIFIQESHRQRGIGRQALAFAEAWCRATGVRALHLEVERENTKARAFYRAIGFENHDQYLMTYWIGG